VPGPVVPPFGPAMRMSALPVPTAPLGRRASR
jgi:hypothetical protein